MIERPSFPFLSLRVCEETTMDRRKLIMGVGAVGSGVIAMQVTKYLADTKAEAKCRLDGLECDPNGLFDLAAGFTYTVLQSEGDLMHDGLTTPGRPDGMACFEQGNQLVLMRNHEVSLGDSRKGPFQDGQQRPEDSAFFDTNGEGGVSRLVLDRNNLSVLRSEMVLLGTARNCAGGLAPGGWLSCEESVAPGHGFVFHCPAFDSGLTTPHALRALGRMNHEAAAVQEGTGICFLTEDRGDGLFYRFVPETIGQLERGQLQAMVVEGFEGRSLNNLIPGQRARVSWVDMDRVEAPLDDLRIRGRIKGASLVQRGEGLWLDGDTVLFSATSGGRHGKGQIFSLQSSLTGEETLEVVAEAPQRDGLNFPDNICVGPQSSLFVSEDNKGDCYIRVLKADGTLQAFGRNRRRGNEIAGVCFSPSGNELFFNLQKEGLTLCVRGPFQEWLQNS